MLTNLRLNCILQNFHSFSFIIHIITLSVIVGNSLLPYPFNSHFYALLKQSNIYEEPISAFISE